MPKSVWLNASFPDTLMLFVVGLDLGRHLQRARAAVQRDRDGERRLLLPSRRRRSRAMSAKGNLSASSTWFSMLERVPSMSDSVGWVSKPASLRSAGSSTACARERDSTGRRGPRPARRSRSPRGSRPRGRAPGARASRRGAPRSRRATARDRRDTRACLPSAPAGSTPSGNSGGGASGRFDCAGAPRSRRMRARTAAAAKAAR